MTVSYTHLDVYKRQVLLVAVYGIIFASFGLLFSFYVENRFLVLIAPFIIWMAITTIFSFLTFPELMGANPFYFLMLAHPAGAVSYTHLTRINPA